MISIKDSSLGSSDVKIIFGGHSVPHGGAFLNEFYELLGLETRDYGDYLGWHSYALMEMYWHPVLEFEHEKFKFDDGLECCIIRFQFEPMYDPENYL